MIPQVIPQESRLDANPKDPGFFHNPYATYARYRDKQFYYWENYEMWCCLSFKGVSRILRDRRFSRVAPLSSAGDQAPTGHLADFQRVEEHSLLNLEPPRHTAVRALVNHAFKPRNLAALSQDIEALTQLKINDLRGAGHGDLLATVATTIPATIISRLLGLPDTKVPDLLRWSHAMVKVYTLVQSIEDEIAANDAAREFQSYLKEVIAERRERPETDLLSHLINARIDGIGLSDDELISTVVLILNAGHEATVHQTGNAIKTILESGLSPESIFCNDSQTKKTVDELMRFDAPLHLFVRFALENMTLESVKLRRGDKIALLLGAANRDPERFSNPDEFDPFRSDGAHVSLGAGIHHCAGAHLAKMELGIILPTIFRELPGLRFAATTRYKDAYHFHGLETLNLIWDIS